MQRRSPQWKNIAFPGSRSAYTGSQPWSRQYCTPVAVGTACPQSFTSNSMLPVGTLLCHLPTRTYHDHHISSVEAADLPTPTPPPNKSGKILKLAPQTSHFKHVASATPTSTTVLSCLRLL